LTPRPGATAKTTAVKPTTVGSRLSNLAAD
jgi:hypothetical protein